MASNIAHRRAAKAARRRKLLNTRRAAATPVSLAEKVRRLATGPLHRCLIQPEMFESGIGTVILARQAATGEIAMATFLVDVFSIGIKDLMFELIEPSEFEFYVATMHQAAPFHPVDPSYARKLLRDAAAYAASLGLRPYRGFAAIEQLFGDVRAEDCIDEFAFGLEGRPVYMPGPTEGVAQVERRLGHLMDRPGPDGFDVMIPTEEDEVGDDETRQLPLSSPDRAANTA
jgi:hypothetical protein